MVFGRAIRDFIPSQAKKGSHKTKDLEMLEIETPVLIQNQTGINPPKWDKTGGVLENKPHSQVLIRVDGSRRVTLRNRRFVKRLDAELRKMPNPAPVRTKPVKKSPIKKQIPEPVSRAPETQQELPNLEVPRSPLTIPNEPDGCGEPRDMINEQGNQAGLEVEVRCSSVSVSLRKDLSSHICIGIGMIISVEPYKGGPCFSGRGWCWNGLNVDSL